MLENWNMQDIPRNVKFYGPVPHRDVAARLAACDVLLAPYLPSIRIDTGADIARWISPLKLFEYMAIRRPILCSDLPVLREVMEDGRNALLIDPLRPEDWAHALERLKGDSLLRKTLADQAFTDLENRYS
jgi:glycosyltransferase involved in cell wall biosynthesis